MNQSRRDFLKGLGVLAASAAFGGSDLLFASPSAAEGVDDAGLLLGPPLDATLIVDFGADPTAWSPKYGSNIDLKIGRRTQFAGMAGSVMTLEPTRKTADAAGGDNWAAITRTGLAAGIVPADADGLHIRLGSVTDEQWWVSLDVTTTDGTKYSHVVADHVFPADHVVNYLVSFDQFRSASNAPLTAIVAASIVGLGVGISSPAAVLCLDRISAYRRERSPAWLAFSTSNPADNLFDRGEPVVFTLAPNGAVPAAAGVRYQVRDHAGAVVASGRTSLNVGSPCSFSITPKADGYYEVTAYFIDAAGHDLTAFSVIRAEGSVPDGIGTFAVLPRTADENVAHFKTLGAKSFFGMHGEYMGAADRIGLFWRFGYAKWPWFEPSRPDRSSGMAPWARARLTEDPMPDYRRHIMPFRGNMGEDVPAWAKAAGTTAPGFAHWDDYLGMVRDCVRVEKHLYPAQSPRIYGGAWELDLNMAAGTPQPPAFTVADAVDLFRRFHETVKAEDPDSLVIGPCPSIVKLDWLEQLFQAGIADYLDGYEIHGYFDRVFTPEKNDFPRKIAGLNALAHKYKGRRMPIFCTECGQAGVLGDDPVYLSQAERMTRTAIILKGEGVDVFLPFFGIDYDSGGYGFFFNLEIEPNPWGTKRISPKPMVNAVATCAGLLEGAAPKRRLTTLGDDVWAYVFARDSTRITAVWTPSGARTLRVPVSDPAGAHVVDMMGHACDAQIGSESILLTIDTSPRYVVSAV